MSDVLGESNTPESRKVVNIAPRKAPTAEKEIPCRVSSDTDGALTQDADSKNNIISSFGRTLAFGARRNGFESRMVKNASCARHYAAQNLRHQQQFEILPKSVKLCSSKSTGLKIPEVS